MNSEKSNKREKTERILSIYTKLVNGHIVNKAREAKEYGVDERSIQRDIDSIRNFLDRNVEDTGIVNSVIVAIMFSEYYFYLTAFIDDDYLREHFDVINDAFPTIYRIDRIKKMTVLKECFQIPYSSRFEEGEFRKRIQFMYGGKLRKIKFKYSGISVEAVLDRLPTAQILDEKDGVYTIVAEVFGTGIDMWLRSQGENVEVVY